jgi:hypothetical protein
MQPYGVYGTGYSDFLHLVRFMAFYKAIKVNRYRTTFEHHKTRYKWYLYGSFSRAEVILLMLERVMYYVCFVLTLPEPKHI